MNVVVDLNKLINKTMWHLLFDIIDFCMWLFFMLIVVLLFIIGLNLVGTYWENAKLWALIHCLLLIIELCVMAEILGIIFNFNVFLN